MCGSTLNCQTLCLGARPRYSLVVGEDVKKPTNQTNLSPLFPLSLPLPVLVNLSLYFIQHSPHYFFSSRYPSLHLLAPYTLPSTNIIIPLLLPLPLIISYIPPPPFPPLTSRAANSLVQQGPDQDMSGYRVRPAFEIRASLLEKKVRVET